MSLVAGVKAVLNSTCVLLEECVFCSALKGPPKCAHLCHNFTIVPRGSMLDPRWDEDAAWCSSFKAEPNRCFLRWSYSDIQKMVHLTNYLRCTGNPEQVVGQVVLALVLMALVLALGLRTHVAAWDKIRTHYSHSRSSSSRTRSSTKRFRPSRSGSASARGAPLSPRSPTSPSGKKPRFFRQASTASTTST